MRRFVLAAGLALLSCAALAQGLGLGLGLDDARMKGGGTGVQPPPPSSCSNALDFSDGCNSQYIPVVL